MNAECDYVFWSINNIRFSDDGGAKHRNRTSELLKACTDYKVVHAFLTAERLKAIQCALDVGSITSKIIEIEKKSKVQFEYVHVKMK